MNSVLEFIQNNVVLFDLIVILITIYAMVQSAAKGFTLSLLSFSKWLIALIITIILVPKLNPLLDEYIQSNFITDIGSGIFIFILSLFIIINISKAISNTIVWSGLGLVDKTFGLIFGIFKGYVICVCLFTLVNWFYSYQQWSIETEKAYTFQIIFSGSEFLINEFPNNEKYYDETKNKIEKI